ncbi:MAG: hypothetical protein ABW133_05485 [Polyangiaceae bacterium]
MRFTKLYAALPLLVSASMFVAVPAKGAETVRCNAIDGAVSGLSEIDARTRLAYVRTVMDDQAARARRWSVAWTITGLGLAAGNFTQAALADTADDRVDPLVGGAASLFIPAALLVKPLEVKAAQRTLEADVAKLDPAAKPEDLCATLGRAETLFVESAADEAFSAGIFTHLFVIAGNGAIALFLGLGYDHWKGALINGGGGLLISEFQIFTQPTGAVDGLARYRHANLNASSPAATVRMLPWLSQGAIGVAAAGTF